MFEDGAAALMPDVGYHYLDGDVSGNRDKAYSGADIAAYPIDNTQESFGLSPVEAMAAGLPVIASDWDGLRDTVSPDVGIRVPTFSLSGAQTANQARLLHLDQINFAQYSGNLSAQVEINVPALIDAIVGLASNDTLRKKNGRKCD
ncbi:glycosyltransferase [Paracoccaceae bacterium]|nr:glycosyltransferase [Paracoccaceae bacterium]